MTARATRAEEQLARVRELWSILGIRRTPSGMLRVVTGVNESDAFDLINAALSTPPAPVETVKAVANPVRVIDSPQWAAAREAVNRALPGDLYDWAWVAEHECAVLMVKTAHERAKRTALRGGK